MLFLVSLLLPAVLVRRYGRWLPVDGFTPAVWGTARLRGCTHIVLEVAENNEGALKFYRGRSFVKLDAALFLAKKVAVEEELLGPRRITLPGDRG